jgi:hypothetical protein
MTMTMIGASLLWVGWFGFNAGSNLEANGLAALAFINTFVATAAAAVAWCLIEQFHHGKPSLLGAVTGAVAGLVAITPASGFAAPMTSILLGFAASGLCYVFVAYVKNKLGYDDTLDVFGVHGVGGIVGAIATGVVADPALGGQGWIDYTVFPAIPGEYDMAGQVMTQVWAVGTTVLWTAVVSAVLFYGLKLTTGLRPAEDAEREGGGAFSPFLIRSASSRCSSREHPTHGPDPRWFGPFLCAVKNNFPTNNHIGYSSRVMQAAVRNAGRDDGNAGGATRWHGRRDRVRASAQKRPVASSSEQRKHGWMWRGTALSVRTAFGGLRTLPPMDSMPANKGGPGAIA